MARIGGDLVDLPHVAFGSSVSAVIDRWEQAARVDLICSRYPPSARPAPRIFRIRASINTHTSSLSLRACLSSLVFVFPPSSPLFVPAALGPDQLLLPWPTVWVIFAVYGFRLGSELTRAKTLVAFFVTRQRSPTAATLNLSSGTSSESVPRLYCGIV